MATTDVSERPSKRLSAPATKRVLPGFGLSLGISLFFISLVLLLPISGLFIRAAGMGWEQFWFVITDPRVVASYKVTALAALAASLFNCVFGLLMAWVLVRYEFPGKRLLDARLAMADIAAVKPGNALELRLLRDGKTLDIDVKVGERPIPDNTPAAVEPSLQDKG